MKQILAGLFLLACLPACAALNCYTCSSGLTGCNDPFSTTANNVTTYSSSTNTYCVKMLVTSSLVSRYGAPTCTSIPFLFGQLGTACCQTDLCNGAQGAYQMPLLMVLGFLMVLFKSY